MTAAAPNDPSPDPLARRSLTAHLAPRVVIALVIGSVALGFYAWKSKHPPAPADGPILFLWAGAEAELTPNQAKAFRRIVSAPGAYILTANDQRPEGFFKVGARTYYLRGRSLRLDLEHGAHWQWIDHPTLDRLYNSMPHDANRGAAIGKVLSALEER